MNYMYNNKLPPKYIDIKLQQKFIFSYGFFLAEISEGLRWALRIWGLPGGYSQVLTEAEVISWLTWDWRILPKVTHLYSWQVSAMCRLGASVPLHMDIATKISEHHCCRVLLVEASHQVNLDSRGGEIGNSIQWLRLYMFIVCKGHRFNPGLGT